MMYVSSPPDELTADQRRAELCRILAAGVLRLRKRRVLVGMSAKTSRDSQKSADERLEVSGETVLSVHTGLTV